MTQSFSRLCGSLLTALAVAGAAPAGAQVTLGQVDDFEDGTAEGWFFGGGPGPAGPGSGVPLTPAATVATGGPGGAGDAFMRLLSTGTSGPGSRLSILNESHWGGNYLGAGVGAIQMDVRNVGTSDLSLRLFFEVLGAMGPTDIAFTAPVSVAAGSGWTRIVFPVTPGALTNAPFPGSSITDALTNATLVRFGHSPDPLGPSGPMPPIAAELHVDNITAISAVPEPSTVVLLASGVLALAALGRRAGRRHDG